MTRRLTRFSATGIKRFVFLVCFAALAAAVSAKADTVVYNNSTSTSYTDTGYNIGSNSIADSFSLSSSATIDAISFGNWILTGATLDSVDWAITTEPNGGTVVGSGTATKTEFSNALKTSDAYGEFAVYDSTFSIGSLSLAADTTYYLEFSNAETSNGAANWDVSGNPSSTGYLNGPGDGYSNLEVPSETFALYGNDIAATPEPSSLLLLGTGFAGLALAGAMRRRAMVTSQTALGV